MAFLALELMILVLTSLPILTTLAEPANYTYMALVPKNIRPGAILSVPVHFSGPVNDETVTVTLIQSKSKWYVEEDDDDVEIPPTQVSENVPSGQTSVVVKLQVPLQQWANFRISVTGRGPIKFHDSTHVYAQSHKAFSIFIQTDKGIYKPGEIVQYRVFVVNSNLELVDPLLDIALIDPKNNKIDEQSYVKNLTGIEGSFILSDMPPLGSWRISVHAKEWSHSADTASPHSQTVERKSQVLGCTNLTLAPTGSPFTKQELDELKHCYFEVREYVLPKFEVTVTLPPFGTTSDTSLTGKVKASYTFGKPVKGHVVLTISRRNGGGLFEIEALRTEIKIDGTASFEIPMNTLQLLSRNIKNERFLVHANVTESITGITQEGEGEILYHNNLYKIKFFPNMPENFKPGFNPYIVWVKVSQQDDRPPEALTDDINVTVTYFTDKPVDGSFPNTITVPNFKVISPFPNGEVIVKEKTSYKLNADGTVQFDIQIPDETATATIEVSFMGLIIYKEIRRFRSPSDVFLKAEILNNVKVDPLKIGDNVTIKVIITEGFCSAKFLILSKGQMVTSGEFEIAGQFGEGVVQIPVTRAMAPTSRFVVYCVKTDGEIIADGLNFVIEEIFENKVTVEFMQPSPLEPKSRIRLKVKADKGSLVNVLAVDKSVMLLAEGNDITPARVKNEMNRFDDNAQITYGWGPILPWSFSADDASDIFHNADIAVLTDANLYRFNNNNINWRRWNTLGIHYDLSHYSVISHLQDDYSEHLDVTPVGQIRKDFPETWIWKSAFASETGEVIFNEVVPDTVTEFVANAFALNTKTGLGVAPSNAKLTVFLPFFVNLQLPYSVVRGETAVIQANIFNYLDKDHKVKVQLQGSEDFVGITINENNVETEVTGDLTYCVLARKDQPTPVFFNIKPLKIKNMIVNVRAEIAPPTSRFDEVIRTLPVKSEGIEKEKNTPVLISFTTQGSSVETRPVSYPAELVPDSARIRVTVIGDVFGPSFNNLDKLIELPYGCGEQNIAKFAPSVFASAYMRRTRRFDTNQELMDKIQYTLRKGYQRQLVYQRYDGSFSAFGDADSEGSLWLTTFVIKTFAQAKNLGIIFIDPDVVEKAVEFVISNQNPDGTINNVGTVIHKVLQGGTSASNRSIIAYTLIALQEVKRANILTDVDTIERLDYTINNLTLALVRNIREMTSDYERAIGSYALILLNNPAYMTLFEALETSGTKNLCLFSCSCGNKLYWPNDGSPALEIETTAYALLTYAVKGDNMKGLEVLRWLVDKRNSYGGYLSTQDTVVALQALSEFAAQIYSNEVSMTLDISTSTPTGELVGTKKQIMLNSDNHDVLQYVDLDGIGQQVTIEANGFGLAAININQFYNVMGEDETAIYMLKVTTSEESNNRYTVRACARYNIANSRSNMAIMDIGVVSGFEPLKELVIQTPLMKRLEISGSRLIIYFDEIPLAELCVDVPVQRLSLVAGVKPANVIVYSYYEPTERAMKSYLPANLASTTLCDTCGTDCCTQSTLLQAMEC